MSTKTRSTRSRYSAVIIEPRKHKALEFVVENALSNLESSWSIYLFHGNQNLEWIHSIFESNPVWRAHRNRIHLIRLVPEVDNLSIDQYNQLLYSTWFYEKIPTETFLLFQTDSILCSSGRHLLQDFMDYDYVGSPWRDHYISGQENQVGNGGLSLRKKSKMLDILSQNPNPSGPEDVFFSYGCPTLRKPTNEQARRFGIDMVYSPQSFGVHQAWKNLSRDELYRLEKQCPEFSILKQLHHK